MPYDVVKTLLTEDNSSVSDTSFKIRRQFVTTLSSSGTATLTAGTNEVFTAFTENDYSVSIMTTGSGSTGAAGDIISLSTSGDFSLGGSPTGKTLTIDLGSGYNGHKIKILATISASVVGAKTKTDTAGTQTVATESLATATTTSKKDPTATPILLPPPTSNSTTAGMDGVTTSLPNVMQHSTANSPAATQTSGPALISPL